MKVGLFIPCYINAIYPSVGVASYKLLKSLGVDVDYPLDQTCCGQPMANAGFEGEALKLALRFDDLFKQVIDRFRFGVRLLVACCIEYDDVLCRW